MTNRREYPFEDELGDIIQKARQGRGISICALAAETGISAGDLQQIEAYDLMPSEQQIETLAEVLGLGAAPLCSLASGDWTLPEVTHEHASFDITFMRGSSAYANTYLIHPRGTDDCIVVDPGVDGAVIRREIDSHRWRETAVLLTHLHSDHLRGLAMLNAEIPIYSGTQGSTQVWERHSVGVSHKEVIELGSLHVQVLRTPGHTVESTCFYLPGAVFTGDTLFAGSVGRARTVESYFRLLQSLDEILSLPPDTSVFPGHGPQTTIARERRANPFCRRK